MTDAPPAPAPRPVGRLHSRLRPLRPLRRLRLLRRAPAPKVVKPGSATTLIWRRRDRVTLTGALTTVIVGWAIELVRQLIILIEEISYAINDGPQYFIHGLRRLRRSTASGVRCSSSASPFLALWMFLPIVKESTASHDA